MDSHFPHGGPHHFVRNKHSSRFAGLSISASAATKIPSHVLPRLTHVATKSGLPPTLLLQAMPPLKQKKKKYGKNPILESTLESEAKNWPGIGFHFTIAKQSRVSTVFLERGRPEPMCTQSPISSSFLKTVGPFGQLNSETKLNSIAFGCDRGNSRTALEKKKSDKS
ncbi:hypothetical protein VNO80_16150 [Phaseolus coccineus]|uniref:Uncharacterized protein n=1 Tax=Phaseolus coccineus TaxID=3886 RepID=A0AAN9QZU5_PHACN